METKILKTSNPESIPLALKVIRQGGLVGFPTDTVYGLACDPFSSTAVDRLFDAKIRSSNKAVAILVGSVEQLSRLTPGLTESAATLASAYWPGALTLVVPRHPDLPENISPNATIGVRMPDHAFALELLRQAGPLGTSSANLSGGSNPLTAEDVFSQLAGRIDLLLDGGTCPGGVPSTVVDCTQEQIAILRQGAISAESIQSALELG
jgi:L-threonylcarbamoyladenylate synthase